MITKADVFAFIHNIHHFMTNALDKSWNNLLAGTFSLFLFP